MAVELTFANEIHADRHKAGGADPIGLDELKAPLATVNFNNQRAVLLADPTGPQDGATKNYIDVTAGTSAATNNALARRDATGNINVGTPSAGSHAANKTYTDAIVAASLFTIVSAAGTLSTNTAYLVDATAAGFALTLPATTANRTIVQLSRIDTVGANAVTIAPNTGQTLAGGASPYALRPGQGLTLIYRSSTSTWHPLTNLVGGASGLDGPTSAPTASTFMSRDASGRAQVATPGAAADATPKSYVDGLTGAGFLPATPRVANLAYTTAEVIGYQWTLPANSLQVGSSGRMVIAGAMSSGTTPTILGRLRCGTAGTVADGSVIASTASAAMAATAGWRMEVAWTVRTTGSTGILYAEMEVVADNIADRIVVSTANFTINTTVQNFLSFCATAAGTTPAGNVYMGYGWIVKP